jgi:GNAT superfamily N-acetyltransferase
VIRPFAEEDGDTIAALLNEDVVPHALTGAGLRHWIASQPERARARSWVTVEEGGVVGWVRARLQWSTKAEGVAEIWAFVVPARRRRGLGAGLYETAFAHLEAVGARVLESWALGEEGGDFLRARGFRAERVVHRLGLDLATADTSRLAGLRAAKEAEGYSLVPLGDVADRVEQLYEVDAAAMADVPHLHVEDDVRLEDWLEEALQHPQLSREGSFVVLAGDLPVAHTFLHVDPATGLAAHEMTATRTDHRRRGLARLAKLASTAWAREAGFEAIFTDTDEENAGMLHLNESLGYRRVGIETDYIREIS